MYVRAQRIPRTGRDDAILSRGSDGFRSAVPVFISYRFMSFCAKSRIAAPRGAIINYCFPYECSSSTRSTRQTTIRRVNVIITLVCAHTYTRRVTAGDLLEIGNHVRTTTVVSRFGRCYHSGHTTVCYLFSIANKNKSFNNVSSGLF